MTHVPHASIVQVDQPFIIVMEYMPTGDLRNHWASRELSVAQKTRICIDILRGIAYLHGRQPPIVHRDVSKHNASKYVSPRHSIPARPTTPYHRDVSKQT